MTSTTIEGLSENQLLHLRKLIDNKIKELNEAKFRALGLSCGDVVNFKRGKAILSGVFKKRTKKSASIELDNGDIVIVPPKRIYGKKPPPPPPPEEKLTPEKVHREKKKCSLTSTPYFAMAPPPRQSLVEENGKITITTTLNEINLDTGEKKNVTSVRSTDLIMLDE